MSGTFSSFGGALSALRHNRIAMDVASSNIANANTAGYSRRTAHAQATGAPAVQALWSTWSGSAGGVETARIDRMVDPLLDKRSRLENSTLSYLDARAASLVRFETTIGEPGENGVAAALSAFKQGWHDVANNPADEAARNQLLGRAQTLQASVKAQATAVTTEWSDQRARLDAATEEANTIVRDLAALNGALQSAHMAGNDASTLLDQRDQLALRLSQLTGAQVSKTHETTMFDITLNGQPLIEGTTYKQIGFSAPPAMSGTTTDTVIISVDGTPIPATEPLGGEMGAARDLMNEDLPAYLAKLDTFVGQLVADVNAVHDAALDLDGAVGGAFFDPAGTTAESLQLVVTDARRVAAADAGKGRLDASAAGRLAVVDAGAATYRSLVTNFGVSVASDRRLADNQRVLTAQVDASRESLAGVNIDEEMVNLLAAQRAYEGASRVITALDSVLDTLINRTGLTR
ncbi:flagellar hook-associated protein FlgK [Nocardioides pakistanensis]